MAGNHNSGRKKGVGRPKVPKVLTPELTRDIVKYLKAGNYLETAARASGASKASVYAWLKRANDERKRVAKEGGRYKKSEIVYVKFLDVIKKAQAEAVARNVAVINAAGSKQWQASAWWLERTDYEKFGRKTAVEHSGKVDSTISVNKRRKDIQNNIKSPELRKAMMRVAELMEEESDG